MAMTGHAFVSYRRSDADMAAQALYLQLRARFGYGQVFMDVNSIPAGGGWPDRLRAELGRSTVVLAVIGHRWLLAADDYGRRRIDEPGDWVRRELEEALGAGKPVIPVLLGADVSVPPSIGLPDSLAELPNRQAFRLHLDPGTWARDVEALGRELNALGLSDVDTAPRSIPEPEPRKTDLLALTETELADALGDLRGWEPWEDQLPREYPRTRQELRKTFEFESFVRAVGFMAFLAPRLHECNHHPRWGNEWKTVQIRFSTWDANNRITEADLETARLVDSAYRKYVAGRDRHDRHPAPGDQAVIRR